MRNMDRVIVGGLLVLGLGFGSSAHACTTDGWLGGTSGIPENGDAGSPLAVSRVSELCALAVTDASWVQSPSASDTRYIGRFYVYPNLTGTGSVDLMAAYSDDAGASLLFKIAYDGSQFTFDASGATGGSSSATATSGWNLIEFEYNSGGNFNYWLNETWDFDTLAYTTGPTDTFASGTGTVDSVRLGAPNGMGGTLAGTISFDAYEAHRTTSAGALLIGDANGDESVNVIDYSAIQTEILGTLQIGQPDCNLDGSINVIDYSCIQSVILGG
jgi:hypothetical protein